MFIPFITNEAIIEHKDNIITVKGNFGLAFKSSLRKLLGHENKSKALFRNFKLLELEFYDFFLFEVINVLKDMIKGKYLYKLNVPIIEDAINKLEELQKNNVNEFFLNLKRVEKEMSFKILKHQEPIFEKYENFRKELGYRGILIDAAPGTGKTFSSLAIAEAVGSEKVFIICPLATVENVWKSSLCGKGLVYKKQQDCVALKDTTKVKNERFIIIHYEALEKAIELFKDGVYGLNEVTVIIDESHNLASSISKRTNLTLDFINVVNPSNVLCLSGTPLKSSFKELGVILSLIDKKFTEKVSDKFYQLYKSPNEFLSNILTQRYQGVSVKVEKESIELEPPITTYLDVKLKNGDEYTLKNIRARLKKFVTERLEEIEEAKEDIKNDYIRLVEEAYNNAGNAFSVSKMMWYERSVEKIRENQKSCLFLFPELLKEVNKYEEELCKYLDGENKKLFREVKTLYKYPVLKIQGEALGIIITGTRIRCHADMAKELNYYNILNSTSKKTILFSSYIEVCKAAESKLIKDKYRPIGVYGETVNNLSSNVKSFTEDKRINPLITTYKALSTGVPLIAANVVVCLDLPFRLYMYDQAISRVWRLGQDKQVSVYILSLDTGDEPNINSRNIDIITFFKEEIEKITGYKSNIELDKNVFPSTESYQFFTGYHMKPSTSNSSKFKIMDW